MTVNVSTDSRTGDICATEHLAADDTGINRAAELLLQGYLVSFPTETVYGLGADATQGEAVAGIFAAKERPRFNPLILHVRDLESASRFGTFNTIAIRLAEALWPGPLTLVIPFTASSPVSEIARAGLDSLALRVPAHATARRLLEAVDRPVAAPSANRSGRISPTTAQHVLADLEGRISAVLDDGATQVGVESTIISCLNDDVRILRPGGVDRAMIEDIIGRPVAGHSSSAKVVAPGMLVSHYAPRTRVRLNAESVEEGEAWLGFGPGEPSGPKPVASFNLSPRGDLREAAATLFAALRTLDAPTTTCIAVAAIPSSGLGEAINDRLARAAAPR